jgi:hypothetical protein
MTKFCENCGNPLVEAAKFCENCGAKMPVQSVQANPMAFNSEPTTLQPTKKKAIYKRWWFWLIVVFIIAGVGNVVANIEVLLGNSGNNLNSSLTFSDFSNKGTVSNSSKLQPVSQEQVEFALNEHGVCENSTVIIISHNIDSFIDSVSYKRTVQFKYMALETTGVVSFEYNPGTNKWQRYTAGDSIFTQEEKWNVNGEWVFYESFGTTSSGNQHFIDFKINIRKIDPDTPENYGMPIVCDVLYNGSLHFALRDIFEEYSYNAYLKKGEKVVGRHSFEIKESWPHITKLTIILDKDEGVSLGVSSPGNYRSCLCERK